MATNTDWWIKSLEAAEAWLTANPEDGTEERHEDRQDALQAVHELRMAIQDPS